MNRTNNFDQYFDWFTELRLFVYVRNRKIDVVLKASRAVVIRLLSLNEAPRNGLPKGVYNLIEVISNEPNK
jgi:hypothetical protein